MFSEGLHCWYMVFIYTDKQLQEYLRGYIRNWHWSLSPRNGIEVLEWKKGLVFSIHVLKVLDFVLPYYVLPIPGVLKVQTLALCGICITWNLFIIEILRLYLRPTEWDPLGIWPSSVCFSKTSGWFWCPLKLENHCLVRETKRCRLLPPLHHKGSFKTTYCTQNKLLRLAL